MPVVTVCCGSTRLNSNGRVRASGQELPANKGGSIKAKRDYQVDVLRGFAVFSMVGANLAPKVSTQQAYTVTPASVGLTGEPRFRVSALDLGIKSRTPYRMAERGIEVTVFPATACGNPVRAAWSSVM